jgi:hypothetical protein
VLKEMDTADTRQKKSCPYCGEAILAEARKCRHCGEYLDPVLRAQREPAPSAVDRMLLPVGRPASAIAAGYLGLLSPLPLVGIAAIVTSIIALRTLKRNPELSGRGRAIFGLVMGSMMTLLYAIPLLVMAVYEGIKAARGVRP